MRGFLIDPEAKTITEVDHNGDYKQIYEFIGVDCFTVVQMDDVNCVYVDDEGLLNNPRYFFTIQGYHQPLAGKGLVLGVDEEGETIGTNLELEDLQKIIRFTELSVQGFRPLPEGKVTGPDHWMGAGIPIIGHTPVFGLPEKEDKND